MLFPRALLTTLALCLAGMAAAGSIPMAQMTADDPACLAHDDQRGCVLAEFPRAYVSRIDTDTFEAMRGRDASDLVEDTRSALDTVDLVKVLALDVPRYGAKAALKMKALASLKALPLTLAWEGYQRGTARGDLFLIPEAEMAEEAAALSGLLDGEGADLS